MKKEILSVIVPVYNAAKYLDKCIRSILNQTYKNLDVILVDDGSADNSGEICDGFAKSDGRVRVYHTENHGIITARKYGVDQAEGKFITFVDSDDWIEADMYWHMLKVCSKYEPDIIASGIIYDAAEFKTVEYDLIAEGIYDREHIEREIIPVMMYDMRRSRRAVTSSACNKIIRKDLWSEASSRVDRKITYGEDAAIVYLCLAKSERAVFINSAWYHYCVNSNSMVHSFDTNSFKKIKYFVDYMGETYRKLGIWVQMEPQLKEYTKYFLFPAIESVYGIKLGESVYLFPYELVKANSQIVIYGAGKVGKAYMTNLVKTNYAKVIAWVDKAYDNFSNLREQVQSPEVLSGLFFDYIVIAIEKENTVLEIEKDLISMGVSKNKIIWKKPESIKPAEEDIGWNEKDR